MFFQDAVVQEIVTGQVPEHVLTFAEVSKNMLIAGIACFLIMLLSAWRRVGGDDFSFFNWIKANKNRWVFGSVVLVLLSWLSFLTPAVGDLAEQIGFNMNAKVPISLGIALAALLATTTKAKDPNRLPSMEDSFIMKTPKERK